MPAPKSILIVQASSPYSSSNAKEALDLTLAAGTFEQDVKLLFTGDACYQLFQNQSPQNINQESIPKKLKALPIFGVSEILVDQDSVNPKQVELFDTELALRLVTKAEVKSLYLNASTVLRF